MVGNVAGRRDSRGACIVTKWAYEVSYGNSAEMLVDAGELVAPAIARKDPDLLYRLREAVNAADHRFRCTECDEPMTVAMPTKVTGRVPEAHFRHKRKEHNGEAGCVGDKKAWAMAQRHIAGIAALQQWLRLQDPCVKLRLDRALPGGKRRPDLMAWADSERPAIVEFQVSQLDKGAASARLAEVRRLFPAALCLWVFDRDAPLHFKYDAGNLQRHESEARRIERTPDQQLLLDGGAQIAWLHEVTEFALPYFTSFDQSAARPDSDIDWLRRGLPVPKVTFSPGDWVHVVEGISLGDVRIDPSHRVLVSNAREHAVARHQAVIKSAVGRDDERRRLEAERQAARKLAVKRLLAQQEAERIAAEEAREAAAASAARAAAQTPTAPIPIVALHHPRSPSTTPRPARWWAFWRRHKEPPSPAL